MTRRLQVVFWVGLMWIGMFSVPLAEAIAALESATLTPEQAEQLQSLPYSITGQQSLFIRYRHVESVHFFGGGANSRFSFRQAQSIFPNGLSLRLTNRGEQSWSSGVIRFRKPMDVTRYNSLVVWVRTTHPQLRFWIGVQNPGWNIPDLTQARTDVLPFSGMPQNEAVQLVIPFAAIFAEDKIDYTRLNQIQFEFGQDTLGNQPGGVIEILGMAFVRQEAFMRRVRIVYNRPLTPRQRQLMAKETGEAAPFVVPVVQTPQPLAGVKPSDLRDRTAVALLDLSDEQAATVYKQFGLEVPQRPIPTAQAPVPGKKRPKKEWVQNYARFWPAAGDGAPREVSSPAVSDKRGDFWFWLITAFLAATAGTIVAGLYVRGRNRGPFTLGKTFFEIHWPFLMSENAPSHKFEKDFWKGMAAQNIRSGWITTAGAALDGPSQSDIYGETFLLRQCKFARSAGVRLFPTLSFSQTVFNYETFLANPKIYPIIPIPPADRHLSDEELRVREKSAFPVWIPPFWQKKFNLPNRVLMEYGRNASGRITRERISLRADAPELRQVAIRVISKLSQYAAGVRIEDVSRLLNDTGPHVNGHGKSDKDAGPEFWSDVISSVKTVNPNFLFIAQDAGNNALRLRALGFDYVENTVIPDELRRHVATGIPGSINSFLSGPSARLLPTSIYDLTPFLKPDADERQMQNNWLCSVLLTLLPGIVQYSDSLPAANTNVIARIARNSLLRKGGYTLLKNDSPHLLAFARWHRRALHIAVANLSEAAVDGSLRLDPVIEGLDDNKLYLFNNPLHGIPALKNILRGANASTAAGGPAMALWGENIRHTGIPIKLPALSLRLLSVNLTRPVTTVSEESPVATLSR